MCDFEVLCDVVLLIEDGSIKFYVYRSVLVVSSLYFYEFYIGIFFFRYMREIILWGIIDFIFWVVLDYIYIVKILLIEKSIEEILCFFY